jgi:hypothetical protein
MTPTSLTLLDVEYCSTYLDRFIRMAINKIFCLIVILCFFLQCKTTQRLQLNQLKVSNLETGILEINFISTDGFKLPSILLNGAANEQPINEEDTVGLVTSISTPTVLPIPMRKEPYPQLNENLNFSINGLVLQNKNKFTLPIGNYYSTLDNYNNHAKISFGKTVHFDIHALFGYTLKENVDQTVSYDGIDCVLVKSDEGFFENTKLQFTKTKQTCPKIIILPNKTTVLNLKISNEKFQLVPTLLSWTLLPTAYFGLDSTVYSRTVEVELINPTDQKTSLKGKLK